MNPKNNAVHKAVSDADVPAGVREGLKSAAWLVRRTRNGFSQSYGRGTLVAPSWVLTAAHCVYNRRTGKPLDPSDVAVQVGEGESEPIPAEKFFIHPKYLFQPQFNQDDEVMDVAVIKLTREAQSQPLLGVEAAALVLPFLSAEDDVAEFQCDLARGLVRWGQPSEAVTSVSEVLNLSTTHSRRGELFAIRGVAYRNLGRFDDALSDLTRSIELQPSSPLAYRARGQLFAHVGQFAAAVADYTKAIDLGGGTALLHHRRAEALLSLRDVPAALADLTTAIELEPASAHAHRSRAEFYLRAGDGEQALRDVTKAIELDQTEALNFALRGVILYNMQRPVAAIEDYDRAIDLAPEAPAVYLNRGDAHTVRGDLLAALSDYSQAISMGFDSWIARLSRGNTLLALQRHEDAIADYTAAIQRSPGNALLHLRRAVAYEAAGQRDLALRDYEEVLALSPQDPNREELQAAVSRLRTGLARE